VAGGRAGMLSAAGTTRGVSGQLSCAGPCTGGLAESWTGLKMTLA